MRSILAALLAVGCQTDVSGLPGLADAAGRGSVDAARADAGPADATPDAGPQAADANTLVAQRPYNFQVPSGYDPDKPTPLLILLHGYSADGVIQSWYFGLGDLAEKKTFLYAYPDGTVSPPGTRFWNATDACCNFFDQDVDDVAYITAIIDDVEGKYNVDGDRIFVVGHSNGGFMSHRLACDLAPRVAAIVSLAGASWLDPTKCMPARPVSVLEVHGDADLVVSYKGGSVVAGAPPFPSAGGTVAEWASKDGCSGHLIETGLTLDIDGLLPGAETKVDAYTGCPAGVGVELWTIRGGGHLPAFNGNWADYLYTFLTSHPRR